MKPSSVIAGATLGLVVLVVVAYLFYMIGLILVLRRLGKLTWMAYVPILNYYAQLRAINAPSRWFAFTFLPYVGVVYAGSVAIRLGAIFGKDPAFSLFWLTLGSPIGMFMLAWREPNINRELLNTPAGLLNVKNIRKDLKQKK